MFGFKNKEKIFKIISPFYGTACPLADVPDEVFSDKILGDGHSVLPQDSTIYAPADSTVTSIADTKHAICFLTDSGAEILLHIGIDSVNLKGEGINIFISEGTKVKSGEKIGNLDFDIFKKHNIPTFTPVIITNSEKFKITETKSGDLKGGTDTLFEYKKI